MTFALKDTVSNQIIQLKSSLGNLIELIETWILSISQESDRIEKLNELSDLIKKYETTFDKSDLEKFLAVIDKLKGNSTSVYYASASYRTKLYKMFTEAIEKCNIQLDAVLGLVKKLYSEIETQRAPKESLIITQEEERKRISREIHDGPAQTLANLIMRVDFCLEQIDKKEILLKELYELKESIVRSLKDIRRFIFDLRPMALDDLGLVPTVEQFLNGFKTRTGVQVPLCVDGEKFQIPPDKELAIFRVIQEAVNNANRHSKAKSIVVLLSFESEPRCVKGVIKDDGVGFDVNETMKSYTIQKKLGLISMEERIKLAGGEFSIISAPNKGTTISFVVPVPENS